MKRPACSDIQQIPDFKTSRLPGFPGIYRKGIVKPTDEPTDKPSANEAISSLCSNEAPVPDWHWPTDEEIVKPTIVKQFKQMEPTIEPHPGEVIVKPTLEKEACWAKSCGLALPTIDTPTEEPTIVKPTVKPHPGEEIVKPTIVTSPPDNEGPSESDEATESDEASADRPKESVKPTILMPKESVKPTILMPTEAFKTRGRSVLRTRTNQQDQICVPRPINIDEAMVDTGDMIDK